MKPGSAKKIEIPVKYLTKEDIGLFQAIKIGRTGKYVETESYLQKLKKTND